MKIIYLLFEMRGYFGNDGCKDGRTNEANKYIEHCLRSVIWGDVTKPRSGGSIEEPVKGAYPLVMLCTFKVKQAPSY